MQYRVYLSHRSSSFFFVRSNTAEDQRFQLFLLGKGRGAGLPVHDLIRVLLEIGGHGIVILTFEENQVTILSFCLEGGKVNAILPGNAVEGTDILVCDFHALQTPILGGELLTVIFPWG